MEILILVLVVLVGVIFAAFSATLAGAKGYNQTSWAWAGLFFGPIALLAAMGLPNLKLRKYLRLLAEHQGALASEAPPISGEDADAQRRRIFGVK